MRDPLAKLIEFHPMDGAVHPMNNWNLEAIKDARENFPRETHWM